MTFIKKQNHLLILLVVTLTVLSYSNLSADDKIILLEKDVSCITSSCHENMGTMKFVHTIGVDGKKCYICHITITEGKHIFREIHPVTEVLCVKCHEETIPEPDKPENESSDEKSLSLADIVDQMSEMAPEPDEEGPEPAEQKLEPPKLISKSEGLSLHLPFSEGKCTECHDAHESNSISHLKSRYPDGVYARFSIENYSLCLTGKCHKGLENTFIEPRTLDLTMFRNGNLNLHYRHVNKKKGRSCRSCHNSHGTKNPNLINDKFEFGNQLLSVGYEKTETGGKCATSCHRVALYDRYEPIFNLIKTTPRLGKDATKKELTESKKRDLKRQEGINNTIINTETGG